MNFYPFHIGDYASHTRHLSLIEDLAYRRLIDAYYLSEIPFSGDIKAIAKDVGLADYFEEVEYVLNKYFQFWATDCTWRNKRADEEIAKYHAKADSARRANRIKTEQKSILKSELKSDAFQHVTKNQEPITNNQEPNKKMAPPEGVELSLWNDYLKVRKAAKKPLTETALKGLIREAEKAQMSLSDVLQTCCERSWIGFKADWIKEQAVAQKKNPLVTNEQIEQAYREECGKDPKLARFNSYYEMKQYIIAQREKGAQHV